MMSSTLPCKFLIKLDYLDKREVTSSESRYFMGRSGKGLTTSLTLSTKMLNKKQNSRTAITDITKQYLRNLLNKFNKLTLYRLQKETV